MHQCHALGCRRSIPAQLHMCPGHWRMVPKRLQRCLWEHYRPGQEQDKQATEAYLEAARACIRAVAIAEGRILSFCLQDEAEHGIPGEDDRGTLYSTV